MAKGKILALHGFGQNAHIFKTQIKSICRSCEDEFEFGMDSPPDMISQRSTHILVFLDGPILVQLPDEPCNGISLFNDNGLPISRRPPEAVDPLTTPRGWFTFNETWSEFYGVEESLLFLRSALMKEHFDGIFAFSQGASIASYLCTYLEDPLAHPMFYPRFHPPMKFAIFACSLCPVHPPLPARLRTPTLHVLGRTDTFMPATKSWALIGACTNARVEYHEGGHFVRTKATWRKFFREWMLAFRPGSWVDPDDVLSPMPTVISEESLARARTPISELTALGSGLPVNPECGLCMA
ncbi:hypothetical protein CALCODRAFT_506428 [Calocera cornea HHB12733]|uniref:Serine hydrolase domain-containing protein n=1 Tax=Calocera cornea HHB12733 TaxID=1353952 RepID=A0A165J0U2_9BASI|nr:hypothetical protein CALCODRAFT_506428 [Calocera cornea HHB12733]